MDCIIGITSIFWSDLTNLESPSFLDMKDNHCCDYGHPAKPD